MVKTLQTLTLFLLLAGMHASGNQITEATVCQILADPVAYNGRMVKVRGRVVTGFEFFDIQGEGCGQSINSITLAYPDQPGIEPAPSFTLSRDSEFKRFERYLAEKVSAKGKSRSRFECDRYEVTATITGRLDGVERAGIIRDDSGKVVAVQGFGHANRYRARLVIQSVSGVVAKDISGACGPAAHNDANSSGRVLSTATNPVQTSVCEITRSPASFDGKMVRLRATVASGFEVFAIRDPSNEKCDLIWLTYADGGPVASLSLGARRPNLQRLPVKLRNDRELKRFQKLLDAEMYPRSRGHICIACTRYEVTATMTGRLDYAGEGRGFGHMNAYEAQLVLASVSDVAATDLASNYDLKEYSPTPVRFPTG